ncbi:MAG: lytic transglycosylase domain-containing protein [Bacteroidetes bacterium]|nr:lytic transglycosylase domain-containing protein [Bacteroidota bacterium]
MNRKQFLLEKGLQILALLGLVIIIISLLQSYKVKADEVQEEYIANSNSVEEFTEIQKIHPPLLPQNSNFCGESIDLSDPDLMERFDRELIINTFRHSSTILILKRVHRYFPIIENILKSEGVPDDMKYLCVAESGLAQVISPSGAAGFWQFMSSTAPEYGLYIDSEIDERFNIEKATYAACKYLKEAKTKFGTWSLAAAAYNAGNNGLMQQLNSQKQASYYDLFLNSETSRYVFRILALKYIIQNPKQFGFYLSEKQLYRPFELKKISFSEKNVDWVSFANQNNISYKILKYYNPHIRDTHWANKDNVTIDIYLPQVNKY